MQEFKTCRCIVKYEKHVGLYELKGDWDAVFICGSIVCFETEIENIVT